jgi:omega-6 fatty acid desaturase (delta-12 desaturase)
MRRRTQLHWQLRPRRPGFRDRRGLQAGALYLLPTIGLIVTNRWWLLPPLWLLSGLGIAGLFVLGHDASHRTLFESPRVNRVVARVCMGPSAHVESAWDLGHNRVHHGYTARQGFDFVWHPVTVEDYRQLGPLGRMRHRLEWSWLGAGAYYLREVWWNKMWRFSAPGKRHDAIVRDKRTLGAVLVVALAAAATLGALTGGWLAAIWMPVKLVVVPFLVFVQIIGWTVYVHHIDPEIRWLTRRDWTQFKGQMEATTVLRAPWPINALWFHNIFVHVPHHVDTRIRFDQLPRAAAAIDAAFPGTVRTSRLSLRSYLRATKACKLYDTTCCPSICPRTSVSTLP